MPVSKRPAPTSAPRAAAARPAPNVPAPANGAGFMSLNPQDFTQGGLLDDVDVLFKEVRFVTWDYQGAIDEPVLALLVSMEYDDNGKPAAADQYYSAGDLSRFVPSEDGTHAVAVGSARGMADSTNAAMLLKSVFEQGFPVDRLGDGDVSQLDGLFGHINRIPQPKRGGNISDKNSAGYEKTVAVVTKIHRMPWEKETGGAKPAARASATRPPSPAVAPAQRGSTKTSPPSEQNGDDDLTPVAAEIMAAILEGKGGTIARTSISSAAFKPLTGNPQRSEILALITNANWLADNAENFQWEFDGKTVTAATA